MQAHKRKRIIGKQKRTSFYIIAVTILLVVCIAVVAFLELNKVFSPKIPAQNNTVSSTKETIAIKKTAAPVFNNKKHSNLDSSSLWVVVNKQHPLSKIDYVPSDLITTSGATISSVVKADLESMLNNASTQSINLSIVSSYRSYDYQVSIYNNYVSIYGQPKTDTFSARPGYSEHQTGLSIDFGYPNDTTCNLDDCFGNTTGGQWLAAHAYEYGFILRYPADKQTVTGYKYEPWHFRYVGKDLASQMNKQSVSTLEEFFDISGGENYL